ncbi:MAG TPA: hypothetical protein VLA34_11135 [Candidatus Krumholzibacterium sp.]|nr:hypothetical protein [Candidatus Krumholzibacterium sp.]
MRPLSSEEIKLVSDLAYDVFERDADTALGRGFQIHPTQRAQYYAEVRAMYEKVRRGDVVYHKGSAGRG